MIRTGVVLLIRLLLKLNKIQDSDESNCALSISISTYLLFIFIYICVIVLMCFVMNKNNFTFSHFDWYLIMSTFGLSSIFWSYFSWDTKKIM